MDRDDSVLKHYWRPIVAYQYVLVCLFDFIVAPSLCMALKLPQWEPLTLKENGFYHMAMATICGVSAWTRGQEKIATITTQTTDTTGDVK